MKELCEKKLHELIVRYPVLDKSKDTIQDAFTTLYAAVAAKAKGMKVIFLTGKNGGKLKKYTDVLVNVDENETYKIQELHLPIYHTLCMMLEEEFFEY